MRPQCVRCAGVLDQAVRSPHFNRGRTFLHQQSQVLPHPPSGLRRVEPQVTLNKIYWLISCSCFRITNPGLADTGTYECQINTEPKRSRLYHLDVVISKVRRNIHHIFISYQIIYLTSFVQYNRPSLPVLFCRVVFRNRTGWKRFVGGYTCECIP